MPKNVNYRKLDLDSWPRINQFKFFKKYDNPFFNICSTIDVTELLAEAQLSQSSFSTCLLYASIKTANNCEEFRYRLKNDEVIVYDSIYAGSTILNDDDTFSFCYFDYHTNFTNFQNSAIEQIRLHQKGLIEFDGRNDDLDIIHYSVIPWVSFTSFSHPRNYKNNDSIPKIVFGKYYESNKKILMPISVEVHHALMDGFHLGKYLTKLQEMVNNPIFMKTS